VFTAIAQFRRVNVDVLCSPVEVAGSHYSKKLVFKKLLSDWLKSAYFKRRGQTLKALDWKISLLVALECMFSTCINAMDFFLLE
jgi:hypothetical protein